jgi:hypothetical protein
MSHASTAYLEGKKRKWFCRQRKIQSQKRKIDVPPEQGTDDDDDDDDVVQQQWRWSMTDDSDEDENVEKAGELSSPSVIQAEKRN